MSSTGAASVCLNICSFGCCRCTKLNQTVKVINIQMFAAQIMFKQLQELQRRQQLQDLGDTRNQNYVNQLSSLRQASGAQFPPAINGTPVQDSSQMFMVGNMQMMQHDAPNGLVLSQSHNPVQPQFDMSLYGTHAPNAEKNLNQYSQFQGPSNLSVDLLTKNNNSPLGMAAMQPFMSQQCNFSSDQIGIPGDSLQPNQEKNLFGQVPIGGFNSGVLSGSYTPQGIKMQRDESLLESDGRHEDAGWNGLSPGKTSNLSLSQNTASLDPLEQKILYNTDDNSWESSFSRNSKMSTGGFESTVEHTSHMDALPSIQSGSWSALMQSAVAETSSSDTGIQEEWSGLSFQNPEPLNDNQHPNFIDSEKLQNNWVDRNLQNATSPSSKPDHFIQNNNMNCSFPNFQQSGHQYLKQKEEYHSESSHATTQQSPGNTSQLTDYNSQQRSSTTRGFNSYAGHEFGGTFWLQGNTSHHVPGGSQKPYDQVNQLNVRRYSVETREYGSRKECGSYVNSLSESMLELLNKDDDQTHAMQLNSRVSIPRDLPLTETTVASFAKPCNTFSCHRILALDWDLWILGLQSRTHFSRPCQRYAAACRISIGLPTPWPDMATQQHAASTKSYKFTSNLFRSPDSASSSLGAGPGAANEQSNENCFQHEFNVQEMDTHSGKSECSEQQQDRGSTEMHDSILVSRSTHKQEYTRKHHLESAPVGSGSLMSNTHLQPSNQAEGRDKEISTFPARDIGAFRIPINCQCKGASHEWEGRSQDRAKGDLNAVSQLGAFQSGSNNRWNFSQEAQGDQSGKTLSTAYHQNLQQIDMFCQNDMQSHPFGSNIPSNMTYQSQVSLQMAPSWFKHYGTLKNGQMLSMYDPKLAVSAAKAFPEMSRNLQENNLIMHVNLGSAGQGSGLCPTAATSVACKQLNSTCMLPSDVTPQNLAVSIPKKRKLLTFDMVPWHKELNHGPPRLQDISTSELVWAQVSNRRPEEVKDEAETFEEFFPAVRAKRRLICTTQLMQQVFQPGPAVILWSDASSNCDYVAYSAARLALGDACRLPSQLPSHTNDTSPDEPNSSKRIRSCEFSKVVECFINRVKKLEGDLSRLDKSLSVVDVKVEAQDLEKFSIINRLRSTTLGPT
ncbi:UNVERIFIED_CONTAM: hypothetical protein Sradi_0971500 [Sesamum radiatum]|uniref:Uncharacterized protein n=1 Tax=Sesamum radiatum TaxID=300843 RepID=A0AAW2V7B8_SESRA